MNDNCDDHSTIGDDGKQTKKIKIDSKFFYLVKLNSMFFGTNANVASVIGLKQALPTNNDMLHYLTKSYL